MSHEERIRQALLGGMTEAGIPGLVAAARPPGGMPAVVALGRRGVDDPTPMSADTHFWIASCTKALTSALALMAVDEGRIGLDDPVGKHLPALASPRLLDGFDGAGAPRLAPLAEPVTLRRLLTHTSGLAYAFTSADLLRASEALALRFDGPEGPEQPLVFEPGSSWIYGVGLDWTAKLLEAITGEPFAAQMKRRLLDPLGMSDTCFFRSDNQKARTAAMHARTPGGLQTVPFGLPETPNFMMGGGGLRSTAPDYLKFLDFMLGRGPRLLSEEGFTGLRSVQVEGPQVAVMKTSQPHLSNDFDPFPGLSRGWTLGFASNLAAGPNGRRAGSLAWGGLANCYYWIDPEADAAGLLFAQLLPFGDPGALAAFAAFERAVYDA